MGEYAPDDSRNVTLGTPNNPIEPERTGPREDAAREAVAEGEAEKGDRWAEANPSSGDGAPASGNAAEVASRPRDQ
ncbi:hypothetical protein EYB45_01820 [Erythrobacteraceae bacterium CFH 75059]|uniref:hypothetical protein n=1 Tax=Qipengyuania thermophila TaxID=2509361 RepID=UPI0010209674|nr:hypothetical protein [Qipengyuania thermophila]TCD06483.1 hypothetical protein EYB45_01820 [Erythrobacteraceae bacterium CFH 75059]